MDWLEELDESSPFFPQFLYAKFPVDFIFNLSWGTLHNFGPSALEKQFHLFTRFVSSG